MSVSWTAAAICLPWCRTASTQHPAPERRSGGDESGRGADESGECVTRLLNYPNSANSLSTSVVNPDRVVRSARRPRSVISTTPRCGRRSRPAWPNMSEPSALDCRTQGEPLMIVCRRSAETRPVGSRRRLLTWPWVSLARRSALQGRRHECLVVRNRHLLSSAYAMITVMMTPSALVCGGTPLGRQGA